MEPQQPTTKTKTITEGGSTQVMHTDAGDLHITHHPAVEGKKPKVTVRLEPDDIVRNQVGGFVRFLQDYAVVGLALGFIVGQQANGVVKQFVASFLDPIFQVWFGQDLSGRVAIWHHHQAVVKVPWGLFVYTLLEFFFVLIAIYLIIKLLRLDKLDKKKGK